MPTDPQNMSRRQFLAAGAAAATVAVTGCDTQTDEPRQPPHRTDAPMPNAALKNLRDLGNEHNLHFIDSEGKPVSLAGIQASLGNRWSTMSFMFAACGDTCPITGAALATVSHDHPELRHIIISVDPLGDFSNGHLKNLMRAQGLETEGPNRNTFILYPTADGTTNDVALLNGGSTARTVQNELELLTHGNDAQGHNATVTLFDGSGRVRAQVLEGPQTIVETLEANLPARGQNR